MFKFLLILTSIAITSVYSQDNSLDKPNSDTSNVLVKPVSSITFHPMGIIPITVKSGDDEAESAYRYYKFTFEFIIDSNSTYVVSPNIMFVRKEFELFSIMNSYRNYIDRKSKFYMQATLGYTYVSQSRKNSIIELNGYWGVKPVIKEKFVIDFNIGAGFGVVTNGRDDTFPIIYFGKESIFGLTIDANLSIGMKI